MKQIGNEKEQEIVDKLRAEGKTIYSISRINSFNQCQYGYYKSYIDRERGLGSCYTEVGTLMHEIIEKYYRGEIEEDFNFTRQLHSKTFELELMDMDFPNDTIKASFMSDMEHFTNNFKKLDGEFTLEKMFVTEVGNEKYLLGYIDALREHEDGKVDIIDWKTSSKFGGSKLTEAGRQLIIYKLGLENTSGIQVDKVMWNMLKYIYVCHVQANGKTKKRMVNRGKLLKEMKSAFEKEMVKNGVDEIEIIMTFEEFEKSNDFEGLPSCITSKYWLEDCLLEYDVTEDKIEEVKSYILDTIEEIETKIKLDEPIEKWKPLDISKDSFFCNTLCGQREVCPHLAQFKKENPFKKIGF
ncbi:PD-(D/E)XK nuclease family protein [Psychrobacillus phage Perkons]|nr:PD-(D/E)XK nuclease family protein [Psychrobacillus phage Perkons]